MPGTCAILLSTGVTVTLCVVISAGNIYKPGGHPQIPLPVSLNLKTLRRRLFRKWATNVLFQVSCDTYLTSTQA